MQFVGKRNSSPLGLFYKALLLFVCSVIDLPFSAVFHVRSSACSIMSEDGLLSAAIYIFPRSGFPNSESDQCQFSVHMNRVCIAWTATSKTTYLCYNHNIIMLWGGAVLLAIMLSGNEPEQYMQERLLD